MELPFDPKIPLVGIYLKKTKTLIQRDICNLMFIAALFTIAKIWKQPRCQSTNERINKLWYTHTEILFSHKITENPAVCDNMDVSWSHYTTWNRSDRERKILYDLPYMWNFFPEVLLNLSVWHWLIKWYRFQVYNYIIHHLYVVLCVHCPKLSLLPPPYIDLLPSSTSPYPLSCW